MDAQRQTGGVGLMGVPMSHVDYKKRSCQI